MQPVNPARMAWMAVLASMAAVPGPAGGEVVDRLAVTVNKQVITERQILEDLRVTAFLDHREPEFSGPARRRAAERMVDLILILQEASDRRVELPGEDEAERLLARVKEEYGAQYESALRRYLVTESEVKAHLLAGFRALRFSLDRFRLEVEIDEEDLRSYYEKMVREHQPSANEVPSFEASRAQIGALLRSDRSTDALNQWLLMTRAEAQIVYRERAFQ